MEWLEQKPIANAPIACKPRLWKRYVKDILEILPKDSTQKLTDHLNPYPSLSLGDFQFAKKVRFE